MNTNRRFSFFSIAILFALVLSLIHPGTAFADDDTPPTDPPTEAVTPDRGTNPGTTEAAVANDSASPAEVVTSDGGTNPNTTEDAAEIDSTAVLPVPQDAATTETPAIGNLVMDAVQAITDSGAILADTNGQLIPLASQQAADILAASDPYIVRGGITYRFMPVGGCGALTNCTESTTPIQAAIDFAVAYETINVEAGAYAEDVTINKNVTLIGQGGSALAQKFILNSDIGNTSSNIFAPVIDVNPGGSVQDGILLVSSGGTVNVGAGTYLEAIQIDKPLTLRSISGAAFTIIDGGDPYSVFISSANVTLDGFTITNPGYTGSSDASGIVVEPPPGNAHIRITNNIIHDIGTPTRVSVAFGNVGINVGGADGVEIDHNTIYNIIHSDPGAWANGISIWGIDWIVPVQRADNITIHDNTIYNISSPYPADAAISTQTNVGMNVTVYNNSLISTLAHPTEFGVEVRDTDPATANIVTALNNWWGDASGPYENTNPDGCGLTLNNPGGTGSAASGCVKYNPWLVADPFLPSGGNGRGNTPVLSTGSNGEGDWRPPAVTPASAGIIPITGGLLTKIACDTPSVTLQTGDIQVTFSGLCGYDVVIDPLIKADLPGDPGSGNTFIAGVTITLFKGGEPVEIPASAGIQVSFPKTTGGTPTVMIWDGSNWGMKAFSDVGGRIALDLSSTGTVILVTN